MDWRRWAVPLREELRLDLEPVAVGFLGALPAGAPAPAGKLSVCQAIKQASEGRAATLTADTCGCPGGLVNLGLGQTPPDGRERLVEFLVEKEQAFACRAALYRGQAVHQPPLGLAPCVAFAPLAEAGFLPDLILCLGPPGRLHRLIGLANYWEGGALPTDLGGPACRGAITHPLLTGQLGLTLLDFGARRLAGFPEDLLLVTVPFHRMPALMAALERTAGTGRDADPEAAQRDIDRLGPIAKARS